MTRKPIAVVISDIHFTVATLELASEALRGAIRKMIELRVPLVIAGDTLDSKAIIRGECANRLIRMLSVVNPEMVYMLVGNHDLLNEKGQEHSLTFLEPYCRVVSSAHKVSLSGYPAWLLPYYSDPAVLQAALDSMNKGSLVIMHQGVQTAYMGHYMQDKTSLPPEAFADFRVISGHYHRAQDIKCGRPKRGAVGLFSYIGNPYTLSFGEADDGPKGFKVLYDDGLMDLVELPIRRHVKIELSLDQLKQQHRTRPGDLIWLRVTGPRSALERLNKKDLGEELFGHQNFKLDKIYSDEPLLEVKVKQSSDSEILDNLVDSSGESEEDRTYLKNLWREIL